METNKHNEGSGAFQGNHISPDEHSGDLQGHHISPAQPGPSVARPKPGPRLAQARFLEIWKSGTWKFGIQIRKQESTPTPGFGFALCPKFFMEEPPLLTARRKNIRTPTPATQHRAPTPNSPRNAASSAGSDRQQQKAHCKHTEHAETPCRGTSGHSQGSTPVKIFLASDYQSEAESTCHKESPHEAGGNCRPHPQATADNPRRRAPGRQARAPQSQTTRLGGRLPLLVRPAPQLCRCTARQTKMCTVKRTVHQKNVHSEAHSAPQKK